jgi:hypothetical protein
MMRSALIWSIALVASVGAHVAGAYGIFLATRPGAVPEQTVPETQMELAAYQVQRSQARETAPDSDQAVAGDTSGANLGQGQIATSRATTIDPAGAQASALDPSGAALDPQPPMAAMAEAIDTAAQPALATDAPLTTIAALTAEPDTASAAALPAQSLTANSITPQETTAGLAPQATALGTLALDQVMRPTAATLPVNSAPIIAAEPTVFKPQATRLATASVQPLQAEQAIATAAPPDFTPAAQRPVERETAVSLAPKADRAKAALTFQGVGDGAVDPVSLSAFQSFMEPGDLSGAAAEVRDGITGILSAVPCSRLQVEFDPDANSLLVSGHVPEPALRATVVAAMQEQMGSDIPVRDNLLVLPRPQCGALTGIASVGLPQSTDQITNPLLVGESTHAREFRYIAGNPLVMTLQGADYDAFVYVDYFDADGNVLHLMPNEFTPMTLTAAKSAVQIGSETVLSPGEPGLYIEIGPPFGQEIAVAFAASQPLYDGVRPLVEPAAPYLEWLQDRVSDARAEHPDFKGEWVYFFVSTAAE